MIELFKVPLVGELEKLLALPRLVDGEELLMRRVSVNLLFPNDGILALETLPPTGYRGGEVVEAAGGNEDAVFGELRLFFGALDRTDDQLFPITAHVEAAAQRQVVVGMGEGTSLFNVHVVFGVPEWHVRC